MTSDGRSRPRPNKANQDWMLRAIVALICCACLIAVAGSVWAYLALIR